MRAVRVMTLVAILCLTTVTFTFAQGTWEHRGDLLSARTLTATAELPDGRVLVVGGVVPPDMTPVTSEIFDPKTGTSIAVPMLNPRFFAGAVTLLDGRVLVAGGQVAGAFVRTAELFDPTTNTWSFAASPAAGATPPALLLLPDGRVFYGMNGPPEVYDPTSNTWTGLANTSQFHLSGITVLLQDGRILMAGGLSSPAAELYDAPTNTWTLAAPMPAWVFGMRAVVLPNGKVLVAGGTDRATFAPSPAAFLYDPTTNEWSASTMSVPRNQHSLTLLRNGQVLVAGGRSSNSTPAVELATAELYSPATNSWSAASNMPVARSGHSAAALGDYVYLFGGRETTTVVSYIRNRPPTANAGTDFTLAGCLSCTTAAPVSSAASSDPDGDILTRTWSLGTTVLAVSTSPAAILPLNVGVHVVTLTLRDPLGLQSEDTIQITVADVDTAYLTQIGVLQTALEACQARPDLSSEMAEQEQFWRDLFDRETFELPGDTPQEEIHHLLDAIRQLPRGQQLDLFRKLGGG